MFSFIDNKNKNKKDNQKVLGEGSYGCVIRPGFNSTLKENKKKYVNKISKIDFYSKNEYLISKQIKRIHKYDKYFMPIISQSIIQFDKLKEFNFDINRCENLEEENSISNFIKSSFFLLTLKYINGIGPIDYFINYHFNNNKFSKKYLYTFYHLNNAIILLNTKNIVHNDLYDRNIIIQNKNKLPIILDFGLSYNTENIFHNKTIDIKIINKFYFTYKPNHYNHLHEKNFINFIINNTFESSDPDYENYFSLVNDVKKENDLTIENILICVSNFQKNFQKIFNNYYNKIYNLFSQKEFDYFLNSFEKYYTKFADKNKYPTYYEILSELLPNVFIYTDLYSIIFLYLQIFNNNNNVKNPIIEILLLFFKKIILADPTQRVNPKQLKSMLNKIFNFIKKADPNDEKNEINNFIIEFDNNLKKIGINYDIFYNKTYAYIDFHEIFKNKLKSLKKLNYNF